MARKFSLGSANPIMSRIDGLTQSRSFSTSSSETMTLQGTINKSVLLIGILILTASLSWSAAFADPARGLYFMLGGAIGGLIVALVLMFKQEWSPNLAWLYAALEGLFLGAISANYAALYDGVVFKAVSLTTCTLLLMLMLYRFEIVKVTDKFRSIIIAATGGIALMYFVVMIANLFGAGLTFLHDGGLLSIGISLFVVVIAALNLLLDFDMIETGVRYRLPNYMEWYAGFSLLVTLVWLYLEILRLVSILSSDD